ncbi:NDC80 [Candida pseudojiufengensis]|uniref:NDC80 n=1 Tax=Candida pseudojiufengensis TaxID=497109 RepID=UPI002224EFB4|nr:NDC80 [Candida pseudojiufengensis]KAI5963487.1 NDC80 [Candida pseudojiufengensis]
MLALRKQQQQQQQQQQSHQSQRQHIQQHNQSQFTHYNTHSNSNGGTRLSLGSATRSSTFQTSHLINNSQAQNNGNNNNNNNNNFNQHNQFHNNSNFRPIHQSTLNTETTPIANNRKRGALFANAPSTNRKRQSIGLPSSQGSQYSGNSNKPQQSIPQPIQPLSFVSSQTPSSSQLNHSQLRSNYQSSLPIIDRIKEKSNQEIMQQTIYKFLVNNKFDLKSSISLNENLLKVPTQRNFYEIFKFLYKFIDPYYIFQKSVDQETIFILSSLQYPLLKQIPKLHFNAVGGQNWPTFLAILNWMVEYVSTINSESDEFYTTEDDFDRIFMKYSYTCYLKFLDADENYELPQEILIKSFNEEIENYKQQEEETILQSEKLDENFNQRLVELKLKDDADKKTFALEDDFEKLHRYNEEVKKRIPEWDKRLKKLQEEIVLSNKQLEQLTTEKKQLENEFEQKGISIKYINDLELKRDKLSKSIDNETVKIENKKDELEIRISDVDRKIIDLEKLVRRYNSIVETLNYNDNGTTKYGLTLNDLKDITRAFARDELFQDKKIDDEKIKLLSLRDKIKESIIQLKQEYKNIQEQFELKQQIVLEQRINLNDKLDKENLNKKKNDQKSQDIFNLQSTMSKDIEEREQQIRDTKTSITTNTLNHERDFQDAHLNQKLIEQDIQVKRQLMIEEIENVASYVLTFRNNVVEKFIVAADEIDNNRD